MRTFLRTLAARRRDEEAGFTLVELVMVVFVLAIIGGALMTSLDSFTRTTKSIQDKSSALTDGRTAMETIVRDLRAANPIDEYAIGLYNTQAQFSVYCSNPGVGTCGSDGLRPVVYRVVSNRLERVEGTSGTARILLGPEGPTTVALAQRKGAVVNAVTEPVFTYYDKNGAAFDTASVLPRTIHDCTRSVQVHLKVVPEARAASSEYINLITRVDLRNFNGADC